MEHPSGVHLVGVHPAEHVSPAVASGIVYGGTVATLLLLAGVALALGRRYRRRASPGEVARSPDGPLRPGPAVLRGAVELAAGADLAVRVEVTQRGTDTGDPDNHRHKWSETGREVIARPFYLKLAGEGRIRVEPGRGLRLMDRPDRIHRLDLYTRVCTAELTAGETILADGVLVQGWDPEAGAGGYRDPGQALVLQGSWNRHLFLSSDQPLLEHYRELARFHLRAARLLLRLFAVLQVPLLLFHLRVFSDEVHLAEIKHLASREDHDRGEVTRTYYEVCFSDFADRISESLGRRLAVGNRVPVRVPRFRAWGAVSPRIGDGATFHWWAAVLLLAAVVAAALGYLCSPRRLNIPLWYGRKLVHRCPGELRDTFP